MKTIIHRTMAVTLGLFLSVAVWAGLETGSFIDDLVITNPLGSDDASTSDDHIRLIKKTIKATFPNIDAAVTPTDTELNTLDGAAATLTASELNNLDGVTGTTGTGNLVLSASPTLTGTLTAAAVTASGTVTGNLFSGSGASLTSLPAANLTGEIADARLSANVPLLDAANPFTGNITVENARPALVLSEDDAAADNGKWDLAATGEALVLRTINDAVTVADNFLIVGRTGTTVDSIALAATSITANGGTVWHSGNDGAASTLDADLLDGSSSAAFATLAGTNAFTGTNTIDGSNILTEATGAEQSTDSFTLTFANACTTTPSSSVTYSVSGSIVVWRLAAVSCTSDSIAFISGTGEVPAAIRPSADQNVLASVADNGTEVLGCFAISTAGTVTVRHNFCQTTAWTNSGGKGFLAVTITYTLD